MEKKMEKLEKTEDIFNRIAGLIEQARKRVATTINEEMVLLYWNIGKAVREEIIKSKRAEYGEKIVNSVSSQLVIKYGKSFSARNLWFMIQFYEAFPILSAVQREFKGLSWTHIRTLLPIKDKLKKQFYATLCLKEQWSTRTLQDRINTMLYERTALSKLPEETIKNQLKELKEKDKMTPELVFRDPYVLGFKR